MHVHETVGFRAKGCNLTCQSWCCVSSFQAPLSQTKVNAETSCLLADIIVALLFSKSQQAQHEQQTQAIVNFVVSLRTHRAALPPKAQSSSGNHAGRISSNSGRQPSQACGQNRQRRGMYMFALSFDM
ncbi:hypothetical protein WJX77_012364 [Trebouxia sp. C0004]